MNINILKILDLNVNKTYSKDYILSRLINYSNKIVYGKKIKYILPKLFSDYIKYDVIYPMNVSNVFYNNYWYNANKYGLSFSTIFEIININQ